MTNQFPTISSQSPYTVLRWISPVLSGTLGDSRDGRGVRNCRFQDARACRSLPRVIGQEVFCLLRIVGIELHSGAFYSGLRIGVHVFQ